MFSPRRFSPDYYVHAPYPTLSSGSAKPICSGYRKKLGWNSSVDCTLQLLIRGLWAQHRGGAHTFWSRARSSHVEIGEETRRTTAFQWRNRKLITSNHTAWNCYSLPLMLVCEWLPTPLTAAAASQPDTNIEVLLWTCGIVSKCTEVRDLLFFCATLPFSVCLSGINERFGREVGWLYRRISTPERY